MTPHTIPFPARNRGTLVGGVAAEQCAGDPAVREAQHIALNAQDGTLHLLRSGFLISGVAVLGLCLTLWTLGGIGPEGPLNQSGWLTLMIAMMCMPFGLLLLLLGGAKWLRNQGLSLDARSRDARDSRVPARHSR